MTSGVLFDVDGTLVDTTYLHAVCWWRALRQHDHDVPMARIHRAIGMGSDKILDALLGDDRDRTGTTTCGRTLGALRPVLGLAASAARRRRPGARLRGPRGWTVGLASSAAPPEFAVLRRVLDVDDVVAGATNAGDAEESKPDPDIVQAALDRTGLRRRGRRVRRRRGLGRLRRREAVDPVHRAHVRRHQRGRAARRRRGGRLRRPGRAAARTSSPHLATNQPFSESSVEGERLRVLQRARASPRRGPTACGRPCPGRRRAPARTAARSRRRGRSAAPAGPG